MSNREITTAADTVTDALITARKLSNAGAKYTYRNGTAQMLAGDAQPTPAGGGTFLVQRGDKWYRVIVEEVADPAGDDE